MVEVPIDMDIVQLVIGRPPARVVIFIDGLPLAARPRLCHHLGSGLLQEAVLLFKSINQVTKIR